MKKLLSTVLLALLAGTTTNAQILRADELENYAKEQYGEKWITATFNDANSVIKLNDKELGTIIAQGYVENIAQHAGGTNSYRVNLKPVIKCDIKDNKVRVTYTVPFYSVVVAVGGGWMSAMAGSTSTRSDQNWTLDQCFPFAKKDSHKKTSSKALVMAHAYSNVVMDKIEE